MAKQKTPAIKVCKFHPLGVFCSPAEIKDNHCKACGWNPEVLDARITAMKKGSPDKGQKK